MEPSLLAAKRDRSSELTLDERFERSVPGAVAKFLQEHVKASTSDVEHFLWRELPRLYKFTGKRYQGTDPNRIVRGIKNLPIFVVKDEQWSLDVRSS